MKIKNRKIGPNYPPLVICELGINHNGSLKTALKMVYAAYKAGAEVIKHQTHIVNDEMSAEAKKTIPGNSKSSIYDIIKKSALDFESEVKLKKYVEDLGMIFISTPFSRLAADRLVKMNVCAFKIGSGECNNYPLIEYISKFKKPMIVSTGMNDIGSIKKTVKILKKNKNPFALLHTTNIYPTPPNLVRLGALKILKKEFPKIPLGLSDHTTSNHACLGAVALGACILERHFTDKMSRKGPDIINSMDPKSLSELILGSYKIWQMRGTNKNAVRGEKVTMNFAFSSAVIIKDIKKGTRLTLENVWVKRPGIGQIKPKDFNKILGKKVKKNLKKDYHLKWKDINI